MFRFESDDSESGIDRFERLQSEMIRHAMTLFKTQKEIAVYCRLAPKTLRNWFEKHQVDLDELRPNRRVKELTIYDKAHLWAKPKRGK